MMQSRTGQMTMMRIWRSAIEAHKCGQPHDVYECAVLSADATLLLLRYPSLPSRSLPLEEMAGEAMLTMASVYLQSCQLVKARPTATVPVQAGPHLTSVRSCQPSI